MPRKPLTVTPISVMNVLARLTQSCKGPRRQACFETTNINVQAQVSLTILQGWAAYRADDHASEPDGVVPLKVEYVASENNCKTPG